MAVRYDGRTGAASWIDFVLDMFSLSDEGSVSVEPIAIRGDDLALIRFKVAIGVGTHESLVIVESEGDVP